MITLLFVAGAAILFACPAFAGGPGGQGSTVNVNTTTESVYVDRITEVQIDGVGTHVFPDPFTSPLLSQQSQALETALTELAVPMGTTATVEGTLSIDSDETFEQTVMSNYNPVDNPDYVIGDPEDYYTWIAIGPEDVNVFVHHTTTYYTFYRLLAELNADCAAGSSSANGQEPCTPCSSGSYQPSTGQTSCLSCPAGSASASSGASACTPCDAGYFSAEGASVCSPCAPGSFSDLPGASECSSCSAGYFAASLGSTSCTACDGGTFSSTGAAMCSDCSAGTFSSSGAASCSFCSAGTFSAQGASSCTPCAPGTFSSAQGQFQCTDCGPGTFELEQGSQACDPCPGGQATPCNDNGTCSDGPAGNGTCSCNVGYTGLACENLGTTTTVSTTSTTSTTLEPGPCPAVPQTGCVVAAIAGLQISTNTDPAKNKLKWKLGGGSLAVDHATLGDPAATTSWTLCIYDTTLGVPFLAGSLTVAPSSSLWTSKDPKGWKYKDKIGSQDSVTGVSLKPGLAGKSKAQMKAAGASLSLLLPFDMTRFFDQSSTVTAQLVKDGGPGGELCWTSEFDAADTKANAADKFKATAK